MAQAVRQAAPLPGAEYESDFYLWCYEQAEALRQRRFATLDLPNLIEEIESMARSDRRSLRSSYRLVLLHLLKWQFQPEKRSPSWETTIDRERENIADMERESPSLAAQAHVLVDEVYPSARRAAAKETKLPPLSFPADNPYRLEQIQALDWMP